MIDQPTMLPVRKLYRAWQFLPFTSTDGSWTGTLGTVAARDGERGRVMPCRSAAARARHRHRGRRSTRFSSAFILGGHARRRPGVA